MSRRVVSAIAMLPLLGLVFLGGLPLLAAVVVLSLGGMREFYGGFEKAGRKPSSALGYAMYGFLVLIILIWHFENGPEKEFAWALMLWFFAGIFLALSHAVFSGSEAVFDGLLGLLGVFYVGFFFSHVILVDSLAKGTNLIWLIFIPAFLTDLCAYFVGSFAGKHPLCPKVSPHKTVEGSIGGMLGSTFFCILFGLVFARDYMLHCAVIGVFGSVFAQLGDLAASVFKRNMGIKDYSKLIPGHGGIMDRFDSVCFTAPFLYYYILLFMR